jgi:lipoprotein NlpD
LFRWSRDYSVRSLICALGLCALLLYGCADTAGTQDVYVVKPQDTVFSIAWRYGLDFRDLARWNNIGSDFRIRVGQTLVLTPRRSAVPTPRPARALSSSKPPTRSAPSGAAAGVAAPGWNWPTDRSGAPQAVPSGGILLYGQLGQDIRAASAGRVVYTGSGIRGYGNLIIIKHGENLLSAYAHNRESLVHDGQEVAEGELIGHMGEGAPNKPVLYFEIRRNGKPIDPLGFLARVK